MRSATLLHDALFNAPRIVLPVLGWIRVARERARLAALDEAALRDIGISPEAAAEEAARPFWELPERRRDLY